MNNKHIRGIMMIWAAALTVTSCNDAAIEELNADAQYLLKNSLTATTDLPTRTQLGDYSGTGYKTLWSEQDAIAVFVDGGKASKFTVEEGAGESKAVFSGYGRGSNYIAVYPYGDDVELLGDGTVALHIPATQSFTEGSFSEGAFPMAAVSSSEHLAFKNLCAVLKVPVKGSVAVESIIVEANNPSVKMSGAAVVSFSGSRPVLTMSDNETAESSDSRLTLECGGVQLSTDKATDFYIAVPAQLYKGGFSVTVAARNGFARKSFSSDIAMEASQIRELKEAVDCDALFESTLFTLVVKHSAEKFTVPSFTTLSSLSGTVDWGDGSAASELTASASHTYKSTEQHTVTIEVSNAADVTFRDLTGIDTIDFSDF